MSAGKVLPAVGLVLLLAMAWGCFRLGVLTQRKDDSDARLRLAASLDSVKAAHVADTTRLSLDVARATVKATLAENRAVEAEAAAQSVADDVLAAQDALNASQTREDSLSAYPPLVASLTRERDSLKVSRDDYKAALAASKEKSGLLLARIAIDGVLSAAKDVSLASIIPGQTTARSGGLGRALETGAIGAATTTACAKSVASFGCIAGAAVTIRRLL